MDDAVSEFFGGEKQLPPPGKRKVLLAESMGLSKKTKAKQGRGSPLHGISGRTTTSFDSPSRETTSDFMPSLLGTETVFCMEAAGEKLAWRVVMSDLGL
jgi:hypothetical protein